MAKFYTILIGFLCTASLTLTGAEKRTVKGLVTDSDGGGLPGVSVVIKSTPTIGVSTDALGRFSINVPKEGKVELVFSFIGMETQTVNVATGTTVLNVKMISDVRSLDQVVVTGYAQTTTKKMTGSVGVIKSESLKNSIYTSVDALMQGQLAGVNVSATSGQPGRSQKIRIRGTSSFLSGGDDPLWVVDGVPLQGEGLGISSSQIKTGGFNDIFVTGIGNINPNDIESITVLKDAAAAAIYGSKAANGVIVVTTKTGKEGPIKVSYSSNYAVTLAPQRDPSLMNSSEKLAWEEELWQEFGDPQYQSFLKGDAAYYPTVGIVGMIRTGAGDFGALKGDKAAQDAYIKELSGTNTNWFNQLFRNSFSTNQHVAISGGEKRYNYYASVGYTKRDGLLIEDSYERYNVNTKFGFKPSEKVNFDLGFDISQQQSDAPNLGGLDPFKYAYFANPYEKPYNDDGSYSADQTYFNLGLLNGIKDAYLPKHGVNVMRELKETSSKTNNWANTARLGATVKLAKTLSIVGLASYTFNNTKGDVINGKETKVAFDDKLGLDKYDLNKMYSSISQNSINGSEYMARAHLSYMEGFGSSHNVSIIGGAEIRGSNTKGLFAKRYNYDPATGSTSLPPQTGPADEWAAEIELLSGEHFAKSRYASFYFSGDYSLMSRYLLNFTIRTDGSSYFGSKRQFNPTWSAGVAWHMMEEEFMSSISPVVNRLTIRAATGFTGNISKGVSPLLTMSYREQEYRYHNENALPLAMFAGAPNPSLRWEKTHDMKIGVDFGLFDDRLSGVIEGYYRKSSDIVSSSRIPSITGYTYLTYNSVDIANKGIEVTLNGKIINKKSFKLGASVNFAYNGNKITKYKPSYPNISDGDRYVEGYPIGSILAGKLSTIDPITGLYEFVLRPDATINSALDLNKGDNYRHYLGTTIAPYAGGFNVNVSYKSLSLSVSGVYSFGSKSFEKINPPGSYTSAERRGATVESPQTYFNDLYANHFNVNRNRTNRWTQTNTTNVLYPRIYDAFGEVYNFGYYNPSTPGIISGVYLKETSYLRIKNIVLSYAMPEKLIKRARMSSMSFSLSLENFFTFTNYDGFDPETPGAVYPISRSVTFGVNIGF